MRFFQVFSIVLLLVIGCQPVTETELVDLTAAKDAVNTQLDNLHSAMKAKDIDAYMTFFTDDGLYCGTDPGEFWDREQYLSSAAQMFANDSLVFNYSIDKREIRVDPDGNSATSVEQFIVKWFCPKIPIRIISHFVKIDDDWKIDFLSLSLVPKNDDMGKLNKALE